ncbi:DENN domain-containing protein 10 [Halyomorpha halys]|uniref:DENN domain-containing protein 10 n=1 Tax=Halyomorpha halys TaxID=286706 RepID=UPI0006D4F065|nr:protein FAM45A-like isoform X1 [Halyomorpha halys]
MSHLLACSILERSKFGEPIWTWAYPSLTESQKSYIVKKTPIEDQKTFFYGKVKNIWFYVSDLMDGEPEKFPDVQNFSIILWARDFNPDKYQKLGHVLGQVYGKTADPTQVLQHFISVMTIGICSIDGNDSPMEFGMVGKYKKTDLKELIKHFGLEAIVIYSAMLLKKRVIVYHHGLIQLLESLKSFPSFIPHRKFDETLFPWFEVTDEGIAALRNRKFFVAGCYDNSILSHPELTDIFVNIPAKEISITPQSKEGLAMTKIQKDVALFLVQLSESDLSEEDLIKKIGEKTHEIIDNMKSMTSTRDDGREVLYISRLKENDVNPAMMTFLIQLATAENILVLESEP